MALASLTVDLTLGLAKFESDSGKAAQIVARDFERMSRPAAALQKSIERLAQSAGRTNTELLTIRAATLGLGDATIDLIGKIGGTSAAFSGVGRQGVAAMSAVGTAAEGAATQSNALLTTLVGKLREVDAQAKALKAGAVQQNEAKALTDDGLKVRIAQINAVADAERERLKVSYEADKVAKAAADTEAARLAKLAESNDRLRQSVAKLNYERDAKAQSDSAAKANALTASNNAYLASLERTVAVIGKSRSEIVAMELAQRGLTERGAPLVAKLRDLDAATGQLGKRAFASRNQLLTLQYTIGDVAASAASGISPLTILLQQGGQLFDAFSGDKGGIANVFRGLAALITPFRAAVIASAAAVGTLAYAMYKGAQQSKEYADAIVLSGNYAGKTEGQFNSLVERISASGQIAVSAARETAQALISTGQIGPAVFDSATEAAARFAKATGKSAKDVASDFASLAQDVSAGATRLNQSLNFLTASQLQQIRSLHDNGKAGDALAVVFDKLNERLKQTEGNVTTLDKIVLAIVPSFRQLGDAIAGAFRAETIDDQIAAIQEKIRALKAEAALPPIVGRAQFVSEKATQIAALQDREREKFRTKERQEGAAAATAAIADLDKRAAAASEYYRAAEKGAKAEAGFKREMAEEERQYQALLARRITDPNIVLPDAQTRAAKQKEIRDRYTDKSGASDADAQRRAQLDQDLKSLKDRLTQEQDALQFNQRFLQGIYQANSISLADYYAERRRLTAEGVEAELNVLEQTQQRLQAELDRGKFKDPAARTATETQLSEARAQSSRIEIRAKRDAILAQQDEEKAIGALNDRITEYRANLAQLNGEEAKAAEIRARLAVANAESLRSSAGGLISAEDVARYERALKVANEFAEIQRKTGQLAAASATAEESFTLLAVQRGDSLRDTEQGIYAIRSKALEQLKQLADAAAKLADQNADNVALQQAAADMALQYAKALEAVDPAMNRLRESGRQLGATLASTFEEAINRGASFRDFINAIGQDIQRALFKQIVTAPLERSLQGIIDKFINGNGPLSSLLRDASGVSSSSALAAQTAAVTSSTTALIALTNAAASASAALGSQGAAGAAGGGLFGWLASLFGGGGGIAGNDIALGYHSGGIVGQAGAARSVRASMFAGARRYHGGGIAGLAPGEVPAILMGGPRGRREEVITASDPRHSDNGGRGAVVVTNHFTINGPTDRRSQEQIAAAAARGLRSAAARY